MICSHVQGINSKMELDCANVTNWVGPDYESPIGVDDVTFMFGLSVCIGGVLGVLGGMGLSLLLRPRSVVMVSNMVFKEINDIIAGSSG